MKKILAILLALTMVLGLGVATFAADTYSLTVTNTVANHVYTAYQIFTGTKATTNADDNRLGDPAWGADITTDGIAALKNAYGLATTATPQQVLDAIANQYVEDTNGTYYKDGDAYKTPLPDGYTGTKYSPMSESDKAVKFANVFFTTAANGDVTANDGLLAASPKYAAITASGTSVAFENLASGYYIVNDSYTPAEGSGEQNGIDYSIARIAVQVVGNTTIVNKADKPTVDKDIDEGNGVDENTAQIGDTVPYVVKSKVPNIEGYKEYYMDFNDTLSRGLTLVDDYEAGNTAKPGGFTVKIGDTTLTRGTDYTVTVGTYSESTGTAFTIHLNDFVSREYTFNDPIEIKYSATVNDKAVIGNAGNPNTVTLEYTNNPLNSGDGTPDNDEDIPHGTTPEDKTYTFVTEIEITKVDGETDSPLANAVFTVTATTMNKVLKTGQRYVQNDNASPAYYKLTDDTYTDKAPTETTKDSYTDGLNSKKYALVPYATTDASEDESDKTFEIVSDANGKIKITGLKEGTYTITEIQAPSGYNKLTTPIVIEISSNIDTITKPEDFKWTKGTSTTAEVAMDSTDTATPKVIVDGGTYKFDIENNAGTQLPETGGIGTTIFYIVGGLLAVGAGVVLVTKKRMGKEEN